jgi:hypothetical protein
VFISFQLDFFFSSYLLFHTHAIGFVVVVVVVAAAVVVVVGTGL